MITDIRTPVIEAPPIDAGSDAVLLHYITTKDPREAESLFAAARKVRERYYGVDVYFRGLIEFTNYCKNDCYYCGIRRSNTRAERYRLSLQEILECCRMGDRLGFRTFVLQGGEDPWFTDERITEMVEAVRLEFPDHAITLSIGERSRKSYERFFRAGANRYLLRHETACGEHYRKLHPREMSLGERKQCLRDLKDIGYQVGAGFMVGTPFQTPENLLEDLRFIRELEPHMVGIGPFIPQQDTPFRDFPPGGLELTLRMLALTRLILPRVLIPATTALGTISPAGRERGLLAGANVVMPNLSPREVRKLYALYDNKICTGDEAAECRRCMEGRIRLFGFIPNMTRGDVAGWQSSGTP
ncbi:MAG: [FeFe] hydrogenase H-cluster radical SAM maturase HydE [Spirochaetaceae bacterium]|jgi:biotin synthase|nr:[FeFe] hydrogenase H-cluster radical SAM maturase HydE [Spirochaetaceae bacterium]